jgi:hypothetical protein
MKLIKLIYLVNNQILISQIEEVTSELGEPDCKLIRPFEVFSSPAETKYLKPFLMDYSKQDTFMISSDKILTLTEPTPTLLEKYEDIIK